MMNQNAVFTNFEGFRYTAHSSEYGIVNHIVTINMYTFLGER